MRGTRALRAAFPRRPIIALAVMLAGAAIGGCASPGKDPVMLPPVTVTDAAPSPEGQVPSAPPPRAVPRRDDAAAPDRTEGETADEPENDPTLIVLGPRENKTAPGTTREMLREAAKSGRERREDPREPVLVLNDENLAEQAEGGRLSIGLEDPPALADTSSFLSDLEEKEAYWRDRVLEIRTRWRDAYDSMDSLEAEAAKLRTRFYSEDDPARRDREIKPLWDRALDQIAEAKRTLTTARDELDIAFEEGRMDGALPGWLREGIELGPFDLEEPSEGEDDVDEHEPVDPTVVDPVTLEPPPG